MISFSRNSPAESLAQRLQHTIMADSELNKYCAYLAHRASNTESFSPEQMEAIEGTHQYDLYWSEYVRIQVMVASRALSILLGAG